MNKTNSSSRTLKKLRLARNISIAILYVFLCFVVVRHEILHIESQLDVDRQHFVNQVETFETSIIQVIDSFSAFIAQTPSPSSLQKHDFAKRLITTHPYTYMIGQIETLDESTIESMLSPAFQLKQIMVSDKGKLFLKPKHPDELNYVITWVHPDVSPVNSVIGLDVSNVQKLQPLFASARDNKQTQRGEPITRDTLTMETFEMIQGGYAFSINQVSRYVSNTDDVDNALLSTILFEHEMLVSHLQEFLPNLNMQVTIDYLDQALVYGSPEIVDNSIMTIQKRFDVSLFDSKLNIVLEQSIQYETLNWGLIGLMTVYLILNLIVFEKLHNNVVRKHSYLQTVNAKLRENIKNRSDLFGFIAHELKTPLTLISSPTQQLLSDDSVDPDIRENLQVIQRNTQRIQSIIDRILTIKQFQSRDLAPQKINMVNELNAIITRYRPLLDRKNLDFVLQGNQYDLISLVEDLASYQIVLENLFSNTAKYTTANGIVIVDWYCHDGFFQIDVRNSCPLMNDEERSKLFTKYVRSGDSEQDGVGLGLGLVREICEKNQWILNCKSIIIENEPFIEFNISIPMR